MQVSSNYQSTEWNTTITNLNVDAIDRNQYHTVLLEKTYPSMITVRLILSTNAIVLNLNTCNIQYHIIKIIFMVDCTIFVPCVDH